MTEGMHLSNLFLVSSIMIALVLISTSCDLSVERVRRRIFGLAWPRHMATRVTSHRWLEHAVIRTHAVIAKLNYTTVFCGLIAASRYRYGM